MTTRDPQTGLWSAKCDQCGATTPAGYANRNRLIADMFEAGWRLVPTQEKGRKHLCQRCAKEGMTQS